MHKEMHMKFCNINYYFCSDKFHLNEITYIEFLAFHNLVQPTCLNFLNFLILFTYCCPHVLTHHSSKKEKEKLHSK
jgi:hypothetical protein